MNLPGDMNQQELQDVGERGATERTGVMTVASSLEGVTGLEGSGEAGLRM